MSDIIFGTWAELLERKDWRGLLMFNEAVRSWLVRKYGPDLDPELITEFNIAIERLRERVGPEAKAS
jgi:hypothetical protein